MTAIATHQHDGPEAEHDLDLAQQVEQPGVAREAVRQPLELLGGEGVDQREPEDSDARRDRGRDPESVPSEDDASEAADSGPEELPAVDDDHLPRHPARVRRSEEERHLGDLLRGAEATERNALSVRS